MKNRTLLAASLMLATALLAPPAFAKDAGYGDESYQPSVGQEGKDVIWVPTKDELVNKMLETAGVTSDDLVYDLGAGDGKIPIAAARNHGARAVGIEFNPDMAALATRNAKRAGVADKVTIIRGDIFVEDFSKATVITMYLLPDLNMKLRPTILRMKPGTRVVSHAFDMGEWEPDRKISANNATAYFWVVPADVSGSWIVDGLPSYPRAMVSLTQRFQRIGGTIVLGKSSYPLLGAEIEGEKLSFRFVDSKGLLHRVKATVSGKNLAGEVQSGTMYSELKGSRQ